MNRAIVLTLLAATTAGCPYVPPETRHPHTGVEEPITRTKYWLYVPSYYDELDSCPLVVTLHGTNPWDGRTRQILEWRDTAERHGLIVVAPQLKSTQGYVPVVPSVWYADEKDLAHDERSVLAMVDHIGRNYRIDRRSILLTGFSSGGFPLYYIGLRNPQVFDMLIARDCNSDEDLFGKVEVTEELKKLPITIFWGKDDMPAIRDQSWGAFRWLREHGCEQTERKVVHGGHLRRPDVATQVWSKRLAKRRER